MRPSITFPLPSPPPSPSPLTLPPPLSLYRGKVALEVAEAEHYMGGLDFPGAVKDVAASADWLLDEGSSKVGRGWRVEGGGWR